jgi:membrane protein DedA with SNARE-associated domain
LSSTDAPVPLLSEPALTTLLDTHGWAVVGLLTGFEAVGLPLPGETALIAAGVYAGDTGRLSIVTVVAAAAAGAIIGDNIGYLIGRTLGGRALRRWGPRIGLTEDRQLLGRYLFVRHGAKVVLFGRFVAVLRTLAALLAGANRMSWPRFLAANAAGGLLWACFWGFGAYAFGAGIRHIIGPVGIALAVAALVGAAAGLVYVRRHEQQLIAEARRELAEPR